MVLVYALLAEHPASAACEEFLRARTGWFTTIMNLLEVKAVLTKVYGADATETTQQLTQVALGPVVVLPTEAPTVIAALTTADAMQLDLSDAVLLETVSAKKAMHLATDDARLADACRRRGITPEQPFGDAQRQEIAIWEAAHLPAKGLPRVLRRIEQWLAERDMELSRAFRSQTGGCSHLP